MGTSCPPWGGTCRVRRTRPRADATPSDVPDVLAPGLRVVFVGINPGRVSAAAHAHFANPRNDFWRLLYAAHFTPRLYSPDRAVRAPQRGDRRHERRLPHDARLRRPAPRRLRRRRRAARTHRRRASPRLARLRRQGGVPRHLQRAAGARAPGTNARRHAALRPPLDVARERGRAVVGSPPLVHGARRARVRPAAAHRRPRARARHERQHPDGAFRRRVRRLVVDARRRRRSRRERPRRARARARGGGRAPRLRARPADLDARALARQPTPLGRPARAPLPRAHRPLRPEPGVQHGRARSRRGHGRRLVYASTSSRL